MKGKSALRKPQIGVKRTRRSEPGRKELVSVAGGVNRLDTKKGII